MKSPLFAIIKPVFFLFFLSSNVYYGQQFENNKVKNLYTELENAKDDTTRVRVYIGLTEELYDATPDSVIPLCLRTINLCDKNLPYANTKQKRVYLINKGAALNNIGFIYQNRGKIAIALDYYHRGMAIQKQIGDNIGYAQSLNNIGFIYQVENDPSRALEYYEKSLELRTKLNDYRGIGESLNNLGYLFRTYGDPTCKSSIKNVCAMAGLNKALDFYLKSLDVKLKIKDSTGIATSYNNIGSVYYFLKDYNKSLEFYTNSLNIHHRKNNKSGEATSLNNIGGIYLIQKNYNEAEKKGLQSLAIGRELGYPEIIKRASELLTSVYSNKRDYKNQIKMYCLFVKMRDTINDQAAQKAAEKKELQFQYEKKAAIDSIRVSEERKLRAVEKKHEQTRIYVLIGGLFIVFIFAIFMFNRFIVTQKQKQIISEQKRIVEEKQKEMLDSIHYAKRIQTALITSEKYIDKNLERLNKS
jgi:tetratricopeptide (TPR) repeat protein